MPEQPSELDSFCSREAQSPLTDTGALKVLTSSQRAPAPHTMRRRDPEENGITVREEPLCGVTAQRLFKMRCECGRSWFELVCREIVQCPACQRLGRVALPEA
jgi:hypothetical protein